MEKIMNKTVLGSVLIFSSLFLTACGTNAAKSAAIGSVIGATIGKSTGNHSDRRAGKGAIVGAIVGAAVGNEADLREAANGSVSTTSSTVYAPVPATTSTVSYTKHSHQASNGRISTHTHSGGDVIHSHQTPQTVYVDPKPRVYVNTRPYHRHKKYHRRHRHYH